MISLTLVDYHHPNDGEVFFAHSTIVPQIGSMVHIENIGACEVMKVEFFINDSKEITEAQIHVWIDDK